MYHDIIKSEQPKGERMKKTTKALIIVGILLVVFAVAVNIVMPNPRRLAQKIVDKLKTAESYSVDRRLYIRIWGDCELNGEQYSKDKNAESHYTLFSRMNVTDDPYHLDTKGDISKKVTLKFGAETVGTGEADYQLTADEADGLGHLSIGDETRDYKYTYRPTLNLALFERIADGTIKVKYGHSDDGITDNFTFLYLDVIVSGEALKNMFLDEDMALLGYDLNNADWDAMQIPCRILITRDTLEPFKIETDINHGNNSTASSQVQSLIDQSFPDWDNKVSVFHLEWYYSFIKYAS